jgi:hypothetical protein
MAVPRPQRLLRVVRATGKPEPARAARHRRPDADEFRAQKMGGDQLLSTRPLCGCRSDRDIDRGGGGRNLMDRYRARRRHARALSVSWDCETADWRKARIARHLPRRDAECPLRDPCRCGVGRPRPNTLFGLWWLDPAIALAISALCLREGQKAWREEECCCATCS